MCVRYEKSSRFMKEGYERDFLRYLQSLLAEVERRIRRGHARLALSQAQQNSGVCGLFFSHAVRNSMVDPELEYVSILKYRIAHDQLLLQSGTSDLCD